MCLNQAHGQGSDDTDQEQGFQFHFRVLFFVGSFRVREQPQAPACEPDLYGSANKLRHGVNCPTRATKPKTWIADVRLRSDILVLLFRVKLRMLSSSRS